MRPLLVVLFFARLAAADADLCMPFSRGMVPETTPQARSCDVTAGRLLHRLRRLCERFPGTTICVRFLGPNPWVVSEGNACIIPSPTLAECCAAGAPLLDPTLHCP